MISLLLVLVFCLSLLPLQTFAASGSSPVSCRLLTRQISLSWTYYITYSWYGREWSSLETNAETNYNAWLHMSESDKLEVLRHYSGFTSQLKGQFSGWEEMLEFALVKTGWRQLKEAHNQKMKQKYFKELDDFYSGGIGTFTLPGDSGSWLTADECKNYEKLYDEYTAIWHSGKDSYDKLVNMKNAQISNAVNALSSELIKIIMDNVTSGKPGGETVDDLVDATWEMLDENLKITERVKEYTGLNTPKGYVEDTAKEFADKFTGEDDRIDIGDAIELINLLNRLMAAQEKHANVCMEKCLERRSQLVQLGASYQENADTRKQEHESADAAREESYRAAACQQVNFVDLTPGIMVSRDTFDVDGVAGLNPEELANFYSACLSAAKNWANNEWSYASSGLNELWNNNYQNETIGKSDPRYFDHDHWYVWRTDYDGNKPLPNSLYVEAFSEYNGIVEEFGDDLVRKNRDRMSNGRELAERLFRLTTDYEEALNAYALGYENVLEALYELREELVSAQSAYVSAWETERNRYIEYAAPYRARAYNVTHQDSGEYYGDWRFSAEEAASKWQDFEERNLYHCQYFLRGAEAFDQPLRDLDCEINWLTGNAEKFRQEIEEFHNFLPMYYEQYAEVQKELNSGISIANHCLSELDTQRSGYPEWITGFTLTMMMTNPVVGGITVPAEIIDKILADYHIDKVTYEERVSVLENTVAPKLLNWIKCEKELLNQLQRAENLIAKSSRKRSQDLGNSWTDAEIYNFNHIPDVSHNVEIVPVLKMVSSSDPYYHRYNTLNYFDETDAVIMPNTSEYLPQMSVLYDDMIGNGSPVQALRSRCAKLMEERGDLLRVAKAGLLYKTNDYYTSKGASDTYFSKNYPYDVNSSDSYNVFYWAYRGSLRSWDGYYYQEEVLQPVIGLLRNINYGYTDYNPVTSLKKGAAGGPVLFAAEPADAVLAIDGTATLSVSAVGEDASIPPTFPEVYWSSSDESIVSVDANGKITGRLPGTATVTATAADSPSASPITLDFRVEVTGGERPAPEELGEGIYIIPAEAKRSGTQIAFTGVIGTNGETDFVNCTVLAAVYDANGRFLGCSAPKSIAVYNGQESPLSLNVPCMPEQAPASLKLFLMDAGKHTPLTHYAPIALPVGNS